MKKLLHFVLYLICIEGYSQIIVSTLTPQFNGSGGITLDSDGNLYIADFGDFLGGPDTDGTPNNVMKLDTNLNLTVFANDFTGASGNEFGSDGQLYQADIRDNAVYRIVDGERELYAQGLALPVGIAFDSDDNMFVCNCGASTITKITPNGTSSVFATSNGLLGCPNGMTIDENDNLYVVNFSNSFIIKIEPDGTMSSIGNTIGNGGNGHIDYDLHTNNLYIAGFGTNSIQYLDLDNPAEGAMIIAGTGAVGNDDGLALEATFSAPNGIAVSNDGDSIYINSSATLNNANLNPQYIRVLTNVLATLSTNEYELVKNDIKVFPNPVRDKFIIQSNAINASEMEIKLWDINGRKINREIESTHTANNVKIDISSLKSGIYFYSIKHKTRKVKIGKIIKE